MATKAKVIRNFFKKFFNLDVSGMSEVSALRDVFKKKYDIDVTGSSVVEILQNVIEAVDNLPSGVGSEYRDAYIAIVERKTVGDTLVIPEGPTEIGVNALSSFDNPQLKHIIVSEGVTRIKHLAFDGVYYLETIDLPSTVNIITPTPFTNDDNLQSITIRATTPPMIYKGTFDGVAENVVFYVPAESVNAYKTANYWSDRAAYIRAIPTDST